MCVRVCVYERGVDRLRVAAAQTNKRTGGEGAGDGDDHDALAQEKVPAGEGLVGMHGLGTRQTRLRKATCVHRINTET